MILFLIPIIQKTPLFLFDRLADIDSFLSVLSETLKLLIRKKSLSVNIHDSGEYCRSSPIVKRTGNIPVIFIRLLEYIQVSLVSGEGRIVEDGDGPLIDALTQTLKQSGLQPPHIFPIGFGNIAHITAGITGVRLTD